MDSDWFGRYKFLKMLGQGGMGTVYLAEDKQHNNVNCVIKQLIHKENDKEEEKEAVRLFQREVRILRSLNHPGVVRFFDDYASSDGHYYLVMDYVPGRNLENIVSTNGPIPADTVVRIAVQCCDVLEYLHSNDPPIIYRDLKPSNLILTPDGRVVFIDFGIARTFMAKDAATRVVTAGYSPPEQYFGRPEIRSDLYSLGATMSHLLTGMKPKPMTRCSPMAINRSIPPSLNELVKNLTAHEVDERPPSAQETRYQLYQIYSEMDPSFRMPPRPVNANADHNKVKTYVKPDEVEENSENKNLLSTIADRVKQWLEMLRY